MLSDVTSTDTVDLHIDLHQNTIKIPHCVSAKKRCLLSPKIIHLLDREQDFNYVLSYVFFFYYLLPEDISICTPY